MTVSQITEPIETDKFVQKHVPEIVAIGNDRPSKIVSLGLSSRALFIQILMTSLANFTMLSSGMQYAFPAITFDTMTNATNPMAITREQASWCASITSITIPIGSLVSGYFLDKYGRKKTIFLQNSLSTISWSMMSLASQTNPSLMYGQILIARMIIGLFTGMAMAPTAVYAAEIAHKDWRGKMIVLSGLFLSTGTMSAYWLGYLWPHDWRLISLFGVGISILSLVTCSLIPETPSWLASKGHLKSAEKSLRTFRGLPKRGSFINSELRLDLIILQDKSTAGQLADTESFWTKLKRPEVYKPILIMAGFFICQQTSGIFVLIIYAVQFAKHAGVTIDPFLCSIYLGWARIVATIIIGFSLDKIGRRIPAMCSGAIMATCMFGIYAFTVNQTTPDFDWIPVALLVIFVFAGGLGILTLPFAMISEMYPQNVRGASSGLTLSIAFCINFVMIKSYPALSITFGNYMFLAFGCISTMSIVFVYYCLPETMGKTLEEIEKFFVKKPCVEEDGE